MATAAVEEIRAASYVGFDSITQQIEHKLLKRGFQFNVIVVGEYLQTMRVIGWFGYMVSCRTDRSWKVDVDQHYFCLALDRLQGPFGRRGTRQADD